MIKQALSIFLLPFLAGAAAPSPLAGVKSWGYQLTAIDPEEIARSPFDLVVIDYSEDGSQAKAFSAHDVLRMKQKPDGGKRIVLAYMSIGEAEQYRFYWDADWKEDPPAWLGRPNPDWPDNYKVHYWDPEWQRTIMGSEDGYLDKILAAGFDGVWLDIIDAFESYETTRPSARREMMQFVQAIRRYARSRRPAFLVFGQNGESLVDEVGYIEAIDGIGKEDLFFGQEREETRTQEEETAESMSFLARARDAGKTILTVDYVRQPSQVREVMRRSREAGFVPTTATRSLDRLIRPEAGGKAPQSGGQVSAVVPGRFFALTIPRHAVLGRLGIERFQQRTSYEERDGSGAITYREEGRLTDWRTTVYASYGVTDSLELGLEVPLVRSKVSSQVVIGDPESISDVEDAGLSGLVLTALTGKSFREGADNLLWELNIGLPTDRRSKEVRAGGSGLLSLSGEHYFGRFGILGRVALNYEGNEGFNDGDTSMTYLAGFGMEANPALFVSLVVGEIDGATGGEASIELVVADDFSIVFGAVADLGGFADTTEFTISLARLWRH